MTEENKTTTTETEERVTRPEEIVVGYEELPEDQKLRPLRCGVGSTKDNPCPRDATTWMHPEDRDYPMCDEHARENELSLEAMEHSVVEDITGDWLRIARAWGFEDLEQLAVNAHESAKAELLKAEARVDLAREIADAPRKGRKERVADLTSEQDERLRRLMRRSDELNNAYTALGDHATGALPDKSLRRTLAALAEERDRAHEEVCQLQEELGIRPE